MQATPGDSRVPLFFIPPIALVTFRHNWDEGVSSSAVPQLPVRRYQHPLIGNAGCLSRVSEWVVGVCSLLWRECSDA